MNCTLVLIISLRSLFCSHRSQPATLPASDVVVVSCLSYVCQSLSLMSFQLSDGSIIYLYLFKLLVALAVPNGIEGVGNVFVSSLAPIQFNSLGVSQLFLI